MLEDHGTWAAQEFGGAELGNIQRTRRLVAVAKAVAAAPAGHVTAVFRDGASKEGAFRLVENGRIDPTKIAQAAHESCAMRSAEFSYVFVPVDGSSLNIADWQRTKGLGVVGSRRVGATGLQVMTAIGVGPDGVALGVAGQAFWARKHKVKRKAGYRRGKDHRKLEDKESRYWGEVMRAVEANYLKLAPATRPWFQFDRGGDAWMVILEAVEHDQLVTVRASKNRRLWTKKDEERRYLWPEVERSRPIAHTMLDVPAGPKRRARRAKMEIRAVSVTLDLHNSRGKRRRPVQVWAVQTKEAHPPAGQKPIEWLLLTTHPVASAHDAATVIEGYSKRWVIEEFHRVWKSGSCNVEDTQLRACDHIVRWATILASVAMRILRLKNLARTTPDEPATVELSQAEIDAVIVATKKTAFRRGDVPSIGEAVLMLANLGGYTGKSSGGPPGPTVITRGMESIRLLALYFASNESTPRKK